MKNLWFLASFVAMLLSAGQSKGDIMLTTSNSLVFGAGVNAIPIFASTFGTATSTTSLVTTLTLNNAPGAFLVNATDNPVAFPTGVFSFAASPLLSNISAFTQGFDITGVVSQPSGAMSIDFTAAQSFGSFPASSPVLLGNLMVDTTALAAGTYTFTIDSVPGGNAFNITDSVGSFQVTAVPEPTTMLTAALGFGVVMYRRRRASMALAA